MDEQRMSDLISRQAAIDALQSNYEVRNPKQNAIMDECVMLIFNVPSAQPEIKPIDYRDCANAMMRMWMDNVVTDGEYNRIMDKLNAYWGMGNGRLDKQTSGD